MQKTEVLRKRWEEIVSAGLARSYNEITPELDSPTEIRVNGRRRVMFCTNDYLALSRHPRIVERSHEALTKFGCGTGGSRFIGGTHPLHHEAEKAIAELHGKESAILFNNGYMANLGAISGLLSKDDIVFSDSAVHASVIDGCRLSKCQTVIWNHNDCAHLRKLLSEYPSKGQRVIICESLYSMDGDFAPLEEICDLAEEFDCLLFLDEIHAVGVYGQSGAGYAEELGLSDRVDILMAGCGKAMGVTGGYIASSKLIIDLLKSKARSFIFTTSLPTVLMAGILEAIDLVKSGSELRARMAIAAAHLRRELSEHRFNFLNSESHIFPLITGDAVQTKRISERLLESGIYAQGVVYPSVPMNLGRLRVTVTPWHSVEQIDFLVTTLCEVREELGGFIGGPN